MSFLPFIAYTIIIISDLSSLNAIPNFTQIRNNKINENSGDIEYDSQFIKNKKYKTDQIKRPNIILMLTDDQDVELGSLNFMPKLKKIFEKGGAKLSNAFVTSPVCCPSRSSILTGIYAHNHNVHSNRINCSSLEWQMTHEPRTFANYLQKEAGYITGYFGKYLNQYNGSYIPPGWDEWLGLFRNTRYYNYTINHNGIKIKHGDIYEEDYFSDLIINESLKFLNSSKYAHPESPILMVLSMPAPHGNEDSAPQYSHMFKNVTSHRTPSWNAPAMDKEWSLQRTRKMKPIEIAFTDMLHQKRLQTLQSVDEAIERLYNELDSIGELNNTYWIYSSDHGYHIGQYGLVKGKFLPYEFDVRVPLFIIGPDVTPNSEIKEIALNLDIAPTILDMARINIKQHMDGKSLLSLLKNEHQINVEKNSVWRDTFLLEMNGINKKLLLCIQNLSFSIQNHQKGDLGIIEREWIEKECLKTNSSLCNKDQEWYCEKDTNTNKWGKVNCRYYGVMTQGQCMCISKHSHGIEDHNVQNVNCNCPQYVLGHENRTPGSDRNGSRNDHPFIFHRFDTQVKKKSAEKVSELDLRCRIVNSSVKIKRQRKNRNNVTNILMTNQTVSHWWNYNETTLNITKRSKTLKCSNSSNKCKGKSRQKRLREKERQKRLREKERQKRLRGKERQKREKKQIEGKNQCSNDTMMNCFQHDNDHWKTAPFWTLGPCSFCQNAYIGYSCLRTINKDSNFLYCEFATGFISYYDVDNDPHQLKNVAAELSLSNLLNLRAMLSQLKSCQGQNCNVNFNQKVYHFVIE
ncbi:unnamed protein product [Gordionus sp. m RMFG-2023]